MKNIEKHRIGFSKTASAVAMMSSFLFSGAVNAAEIPLFTDNGTDTGWVAITNDADSVVFTSIMIPRPNNMALKIDADVGNELHIRFEQKEITEDFAGFVEETQTFFFVDGRYANVGENAWTGAMFDSRDGLGRTISISGRDDHPGAIHYHGPVGAHVVYNPGDSLVDFDGLWNPNNHPFGETMPIQYPDFGQDIGLGVKSVTLCGGNSAENSVASDTTGDFMRQRIHLKNPDMDISDDGLSEAEKKALEEAKENGLVGFKLVSFDYWFIPNPESCNGNIPR